MAKDITEIINAAAVVRDETGEAANTAARVGGSIADVAQYIQEEIITPLLATQSQAVSAERIAEYAKKISEEAAQKISTAIADKDYYRQNIYLLQEGIGCAAFDYATSLADVTIQSAEVTRQEGDAIILDTSANRFVLKRLGKYYNKFLSNGASLQGADVYASNRHTFLNRQDTSYWYWKKDGTLTKGSSTFVIKNWLEDVVARVSVLEMQGGTSSGLEALQDLIKRIEEAENKNKEQDNRISQAQTAATHAQETAEEAKTIAENAAGGASSEEIAALKDKDAEHDSKINKLEERVLEYLYHKIYKLFEGAGARKFHGFTKEDANLAYSGFLVGNKSYSVLYSTSGKKFVLKVTLEPIGEPKPATNYYGSWEQIVYGDVKIASSESYAERDKLFYIYEDGYGSTYYYIDGEGNAVEASATYLLRKLVDALAKEVKSLKADADTGVARNISLTDNKTLRLLNGQGGEIGTAATLQDKSNLYEGSAGTSSVPLVMTKTFGDTVTAKLGAATTARAGVMTVDHVNKIEELGKRVLQYLYPKIYQLNEGAGAREFDGFYTGAASVSAERKTAGTEGFTYKVVFHLGKFHLQELSPGGATLSLYSEWDRIGNIASSESYAERDKLFYIYVAGEGSTYYYIDGEGNAVEASATYLLRKLVDKQKIKLDNYADTFVTNPVASADNNGLMSSLDKEKLDTYAETFEENPIADSGNISGTPRAGLMASSDKKKLENYSLYFQENDTATETQAGLMSAEDKAKFDNVDWQELLAYGISYNSKYPDTTLVRIGNIDLHRRLPIQSKMRGGTLLPNAEGGCDFTPFANTDDWTGETRDGSAGDVMVEIPCHYVKFVTKGNRETGESREVWLSEYPLPGFKCVPTTYVGAYECAIFHPSNYQDAFVRTVVNNSADYRGGDGDLSYDADETSSRLGVAAMGSKIQYAKNPLSYLGEKSSFYDYAVHKDLYWLMCVEYGTLNLHKGFEESRDIAGYMQGGLGVSVQFIGYFKIGVTDCLGNNSGIVESTNTEGTVVNIPRYRGIEFPFGGSAKIIEGVSFGYSREGYFAIYTTAEGHAPVGIIKDGVFNKFGNDEEWNMIGEQVADNQIKAYVTDIVFGPDGDIVPIAKGAGGGSNEYYCDITDFYKLSKPIQKGYSVACSLGYYTEGGMITIKPSTGGEHYGSTSYRVIYRK